MESLDGYANKVGVYIAYNRHFRFKGTQTKSKRMEKSIPHKQNKESWDSNTFNRQE